MLGAFRVPGTVDGMTVYEQRGYLIDTASEAREFATSWLEGKGISGFALGLPEVDDRYHLWRVPVLGTNGSRVGEVAIAALDGQVDEARTATHLSSANG